MLIVLTGKTASGKDTIKDALLLRYPNLKRVITTTSRPLREGEKDGVEYRFLSREQFHKGIHDGLFIEYVEYGGNLYGTQKKDIESYISSDLLWKIDPSFAGKVRTLFKDKKIMVIYINCPEDVILQRLRERNLPEEEIESRMADDEAFFQEFREKYDYVIENEPGNLKEAVDKIVSIIENHSF